MHAEYGAVREKENTRTTETIDGESKKEYTEGCYDRGGCRDRVRWRHIICCGEQPKEEDGLP